MKIRDERRYKKEEKIREKKLCESSRISVKAGPGLATEGPPRREQAHRGEVGANLNGEDGSGRGV